MAACYVLVHIRELNRSTR